MIELLIVVAIIGIIAAIAIPNLLNAIDRGKQKRTMADLRSIGTAVESFAVDNNVYPVAATPAASKTIVETGAYMKTMPSADGWQNAFLIDSVTTGYTLQSPGKLGANDGCVAGRSRRCSPRTSASRTGSSSSTRTVASSKTISIA